ncbi:hypothetical protein B0T20DRAFT_253906 [Sordaria brevicollis]|uniref:HIT-type domain-containing protein n=1 Tax=Sordaria brevicollis TaxID=83679 RepID=A0AAE0PCC1_SORBR|nr:hypothetical protein B0T20DRAFT_253906 [Sordaria brevicollis]
MSTELRGGDLDMASDESQRLFADELKALINDASGTQDDGQQTTETQQVNGETVREGQQEATSQPQIDQKPEEEQPTYVTRKTNDNQQEEQGAQAATEHPVNSQEPTSPSRKRPNSDAESSPKPAKKEVKQCGICQAQPGKYRCPRCPVMYCSIACNKIHKENHPPPTQEPAKPSQPATQQRPAPSKPDPLAFLLPHTHHITRLLTKYPHLESRIEHILSQTLPPANNPQGLAINPDTGFATTASGLPIKVPGYASSSGKSYMKKDNQPWSKEVGLRRGAAALKRARMDPTETGDGVRELCETVLWLLKAQERGELPSAPGQPANDVTQFVREEVVREEQEVVKRLLEEEIRREGGDR